MKKKNMKEEEIIENVSLLERTNWKWLWNFYRNGLCILSCILYNWNYFSVFFAKNDKENMGGKWVSALFLGTEKEFLWSGKTLIWKCFR